MYKRPDSDIFGTKEITTSVRIQNDSVIDPNEAFKRKNNENYAKYNEKIGNVGKKNLEGLIAGNPEATLVNEKANFEDDYHKSRKEKDLQSTIFYKQKEYPRPKTQQGLLPSEETAILLDSRKVNPNVPKPNEEYCHGRKNTFKREIESLPYNHSNIKGNESQLFGFTDDNDSGVHRASNTPNASRKMPVLLPHQMQWNQHDSIRYQHRRENIEEGNILGDSNVFNKVIEVKSTEDKEELETRAKEEACLEKFRKLKEEEEEQKRIKERHMTSKNGKPKTETVVEPKPIDVEVRVLKGWDNKYMEGLSKYLKMYSTPMTKFEMQGAGKAVLFLKRTKRWEAVTDWLTKDAKMRLRIMNP